MEHLTIAGNGAQFHVAKIGAGEPLLMLHGWPEFWLTKWAIWSSGSCDRHDFTARCSWHQTCRCRGS